MACPDSIGGGCDFTQNPTVWFQVNTDGNAMQLYTQVTTNGSWTPMWSVWHPEPDCDNLVNIGYSPCSNQSAPLDLLIVPVGKDDTYYISITAYPNGKPIDDSDFNICTLSLPFDCEPNESLIFEVTARENTELESDRPPFFGPFCPGEKVSVHMKFTFDGTQTGDDWLMSLIPKFGNGWDMTDFDFTTNIPKAIPPLPAEYYESNGDCAPLATEAFSYLCTYVDSDGNLRLCNTECETCPCSKGLEIGDTLPSGYFWVQEGTSPKCDSNSCSPSKKYGIGTPVCTINWDINLKVKEFENSQDCFNNNDLKISFMVFSDGNVGCWDDPIDEYMGGKPHSSPPWKVSCYIPPHVISIPQTKDICSKSEVGIAVSTYDGSTELVEITYNKNPNIFGANTHNFLAGNGIINDTLIIKNHNICEPQVIYYYARTVTTIESCTQNIDTIEVIVYPTPEIVTQDTLPVRRIDNLPSALPINAKCGYPANYYFKWEDNLIGKSGEGDSIFIDKSFGVGLHIFNITVTDELGCDNTGKMLVYLYDDNSYLYIKSKKRDASCFGECDGEITISNVLNSTPPVSYQWSTGDTIASVNNLCAGIYTVKVTDNNDKSSIDTIIINQPKEIIITIDTVLHITDSNKGGVFVTTNNNGNYIYDWIGPEGFSAKKQNITNLANAGCYTFTVIDTLINCKRDTTICIENKTAVTELYKNNSAYIVPNPNTGIFDLILGDILSGNLLIELYSNNGKKIYSNTYEINDNQKSLRFDFTLYTSGMYFMKLVTKDKIEIVKFVHR